MDSKERIYEHLEFEEETPVLRWGENSEGFPLIERGNLIEKEPVERKYGMEPHSKKE